MSAYRYRVERAVTDAGYASGWLVLGASGGVIAQRTTWALAYECAYIITRGGL